MIAVQSGRIDYQNYFVKKLEVSMLSLAWLILTIRKNQPQIGMVIFGLPRNIE
jgi:hypothetical protein